jgi:predicted permease
MEATVSSAVAYTEKVEKNVRRFSADGAIARNAAFLQWLSVVVAMGIALFFAAYFGLVARIWRDDSSHMSSVIAALVVGTAAYIGWLCWRVPDACSRGARLAEVSEIEDAAEWGGIAADLCPAIGLAGTIYGLAQQAVALKEGGDVLALLGTALFSTLSGVTGFAIVLILSHVLNSSLRRARRHG